MASAATTHPTLMSGSVGEEVTYLQQLLNKKSHATIAVDGYFGDETKQMVEIYQRNHGLVVDGYFGSETKQMVEIHQRNHELVVDGIVGSQTWSSLES